MNVSQHVRPKHRQRRLRQNFFAGYVTYRQNQFVRFPTWEEDAPVNRDVSDDVSRAYPTYPILRNNDSFTKSTQFTHFVRESGFRNHLLQHFEGRLVMDVIVSNTLGHLLISQCTLL